MLRASGEIEGEAVDVGALIGEAESHVPHGAVLLELAEAMVEGDESRLNEARQAVFEAQGPEAMVDAVGVAANFERMVRIADSTGIPLGDYMDRASSDVRRELDLERLHKD
ncbi:MAG: hypothetical protein ACR2RL_02240 [Gammaproteobacteria bacterium]